MNIKKPTAILNPEIAKRNIHNMAEKARRNGVHFRPHFKTPQSAEIGEWFKAEGIHAITVSSVEMACYFAEHGWQDILIAFPVNWLQIVEINQLAAKINLHLLVESVETVEFLQANLAAPVQLWLKIDAGYRRTGLEWNGIAAIEAVISAIQRSDKLTLQGILTHSGHSYKARGAEEVIPIYRETVDRMKFVRDTLAVPLKISIGDTPSCSVVDDLSEVDEIRPGNFVFYDWMQVKIGSCQPQDIAMAVACPVVAKHPSRDTLIIYGGSVHFSRDNLNQTFGVVMEEWGTVIPDTYVSSLSQEHGMVKTTPEFLSRVNVGDVLMIYPIHSCLTADLLKHYVTTEGKTITMMGYGAD